MAEEEQRDFAQELEQYLEEHTYDLPKKGEVRQGVIVSVSQQGIIVDLGLKRDGLVPSTDLQKLTDEEMSALKADDEVTVVVLGGGDSDSLLVSLSKAREQEDWKNAQVLMESGEMIEGEVLSYNKGGVLVAFGRLRGFVPQSHLVGFGRNMDERARQRKLAKMRGEPIAVKIIEVDNERQRLVMSQRAAQREFETKRRAELMDKITVGDVYTGRVRNIRDFGAFVDLGGIDGLVHVSELAWHRVSHPKEVLKVGDEIEVKVLKVDEKNQRISLSRRVMIDNPWDVIDTLYVENQLVEGRIVRLVDYGAFVELQPGVEGLLHTSQLARTNIADPREVVAEGETHLLRVLEVDDERQRIRLSLKAVTAREQIDWMTKQAALQSEAAQKAEEEAAAAAEAPAAEAPDAPDAAAAEAPAAEAAEAVAETAEAADATVEAAAEPVAEAAEAASEAAVEAVPEAAEAAPEAVEAVAEAASEATDAAAEATESVDEAAEAVADVAAETAEATAEDATEAVAEAATETVDAAADTVEEATEAVESAAETAAETATETVEAAVNEAADIATDAAETVVDAAQDAAEEATE